MGAEERGWTQEKDPFIFVLIIIDNNLSANRQVLCTSIHNSWTIGPVAIVILMVKRNVY